MRPESHKSLRRDRILHAAGRLFASQGYHGTSTRQIAHLANTNENTLFRYFDDKESLFWSTLGAHYGALDFHRNLLEKMVACESPHIVLPKLVELFGDTVSYRTELLRLTLVAYLEMHPKGEAFIRERLSPILLAISQYLERNIKGGKIRGLDPTMVTVALTMTALTHPEISALIDKDGPLLNYQEKNRAQARFWLDMLEPGLPGSGSLVAAIGDENSG